MKPLVIVISLIVLAVVVFLIARPRSDLEVPTVDPALPTVEDDQSRAAPPPPLEWSQHIGYRAARLPAPAAGARANGFTRLDAVRTGIAFTNTLSVETLAANTLLINGSGVACGDVDGDGLVDLYFASIEGENALLLNLGNWRFENITAKAGVGCGKLASAGAAFADTDGDGDLDLLVTTTGRGVQHFRGDGRGGFVEATVQAGLMSNGGATTATLADVDADGDLDLYVARYRADTWEDLNPRPSVTFMRSGGEDLVSPAKWRDRLIVREGQIREIGEVDLFFLGDGKGGFEPVALDEGRFTDSNLRIIEEPKDWGLCAMFTDLDDDGCPDLYVCNDFWTPDRVWMNCGAANFTALESTMMRTTSKFSMAVDTGDINRDGNTDVFVVDMLARTHARRQRQGGVAEFEAVPQKSARVRMQTPRNTLQLGCSDGSFAEVAQYAGVEASEWTWSTLMLDVDLDGWLDLLCGNGNLFDPMDSDAALLQVLQAPDATRAERLRAFPPSDTPNVAFRNLGDVQFAEVGAAWGFDARDVTNGMAMADLDGDGDLDVVANHLRAPAGIYRNESVAPRVAVRLIGSAMNTRAIGARVTLIGAGAPQSREVRAGGSYLSHSDELIVFGAPAESSGDTTLSLEVRWPTGQRSLIDSIEQGYLYEINETEMPKVLTPLASETSPLSPPTQALFEQSLADPKHAHVERVSDDFARQPLLPRKLSQMAPAVLWHDFDRDGDDDLVLGESLDPYPGIFENASGKFVAIATPNSQDEHQQPIGGLVAASGGAGVSTLVAASFNFYGDLWRDAPPWRSVTWNGGVWLDQQVGEVVRESIGALALADLDGDDALDLVAAGRTIPGAYGAPTSLHVYRGSAAGFVRDEAECARHARLGMISSIVLADLDQDGDQDAALALDWGPVRILENRGGQLHDVTETVGLLLGTGQWNGITAGDLDGDGILDLVVTGWGRNHRRRWLMDEPLMLFHGDLDGNGVYEAIEAHHDVALDLIVPDRGLRELMPAFPSIPRRIRYYSEFAAADVDLVFGPEFKRAAKLEARMTEHLLLLGRGSGALGGGARTYEGRPLPAASQLSPAFGVVVADLDGDGNEDVFLAQNFFAVEPLESRMDAGRSLVLQGDGKGGLTAMPSERSGILVWGQARGAAVADYDRDGRVDLCIGQNDEPALLYRNRGARPGLRVRLQGSAGNLDGIGAILRLGKGEHLGPARPVLAGSGFWSQSSTSLVLAREDGADRLVVIWPDGYVSETKVPANALEVLVNRGGEVQVTRER